MSCQFVVPFPKTPTERIEGNIFLQITMMLNRGSKPNAIIIGIIVSFSQDENYLLINIHCKTTEHQLDAGFFWKDVLENK
jgi:hypothetical protein